MRDVERARACARLVAWGGGRGGITTSERWSRRPCATAGRPGRETPLCVVCSPRGSSGVALGAPERAGPAPPRVTTADEGWLAEPM